MKYLVTISLLFVVVTAYSQVRTDTFSFHFDGKRYYGIIDQPQQKPARALAVIIPGSGKTNIVEENWFSNLRKRFAEVGIASLIWDKAGCGKSEGLFDYNQSVYNNASEAVAAIKEAQSRSIPGAEKIGLWGISRGGWICPLVVEQTPIAFWISVSGTDDKENFGYLLQTNFAIEGRSEAQIQLLVAEWKKGNELFNNGGSFQEYQQATANLRQDSFWMAVSGSPYTQEGYERNQKQYMKDPPLHDKASGLRIYIQGFDTLLNKIDCPVLALFGEKDSQVNWRNTLDLYKKTIGKNSAARLTWKVFPDCNHNMLTCQTGGYREDLTKFEACTGYYDAMLSWLKDIGFGK